MITAQEAKALYDSSGAEVQEFLKHHADGHVKKAAQAGKRTYTIHRGCTEVWNPPTCTPLDVLVIKELERLGYRARFGADDKSESYVPAGLRDDDGGGPEHVNYGITITW